MGSQLSNSGRMAGQIFGKGVSFVEFDAAYRAVQLFSFGDNNSAEAKPTELLRRHAWENIMLSREAKNQKIDVSDQEVKDEIFRLMKLQKIDNPTSEIYHRWVKAGIRETPQVFEGQIRELLRIQKIVKKINDASVSTPSDQDLLTQYHLNEDKISFESASFKNLEEAKQFLDKAKTTKDLKSLLSKEQSLNSGTLMSLDVLINHWRVPQANALELANLKKGNFSDVIQTGENFSVFKITDSQKASDKNFTEEIKKKYVENFKGSQKQERFILWMSDLQERANIKDYQQSNQRPSV